MPNTNRLPSLALLRELVRCYQAFERYSASHIQCLGLTPAQFDVLATLGNTDGMNPKQLGEKTLITKGTLTGVVDRLAAKCLVRRDPDPNDGRGQIVRLTPDGQALFEEVFPAHRSHMDRAFNQLDDAQVAQAQAALRGLRAAFEEAAATDAPAPASAKSGA